MWTQSVSVVAACRALETDPACEHDKIDEKALLSWKEYPDRVVVIIETGQKYTVDKDDLQSKRKQAERRQAPKTDAAKTGAQKK